MTNLQVLIREIAAGFTVALVVAIIIRWRRTMIWRDNVTRLLVSLVSVIGTLCLLTVIRLGSHSRPDSGWFGWLNVAVFVGVPIVMAWCLAIVIRHTRYRR